MRQVSFNDLCDLTGLSKRAIQKTFEKCGVKPVSQEGSKHIFTASEALRAIYQGSDQTKELREREAKARTEKLEIEVAVMKGELVEIDQVCAAVEKEFVIVRQRLLTIPTKVAKPLSFVDSPTEIQNILTDSISECLEELRYDKQAKRQAERTSKEDSEATTKKKPGSVGRPRKTSVTRKQR